MILELFGLIKSTERRLELQLLRKCLSASLLLIPPMVNEDGGNHSQIVHLENGVDCVLLMNGGANADGSKINPLGPTMKGVNQVLRYCKQWPEEDLFQRYR